MFYPNNITFSTLNLNSTICSCSLFHVPEFIKTVGFCIRSEPSSRFTATWSTPLSIHTPDQHPTPTPPPGVTRATNAEVSQNPKQQKNIIKLKLKIKNLTVLKNKNIITTMRKKTLTLKLKPLQSSCWKIKEFLVLIWLSNLTNKVFILQYNKHKHDFLIFF